MILRQALVRAAERAGGMTQADASKTVDAVLDELSSRLTNTGWEGQGDNRSTLKLIRDIRDGMR